MKSRKTILIILMIVILILSSASPLINGIKTKSEIPIKEISNKKDVKTAFSSLANQLEADLQIRIQGGSWQDDSITADVGTILEFKVWAKSNRAYLLLSILNILPTINGNPMFDYIEDSASPIPLPPNLFDANDTQVTWVYLSVLQWWEKTFTWKARIVQPGTGDVEMAASGLIPGTEDFDVVLDTIPVTGVGDEVPILSYSPTSHDFGDVQKGDTKSTSFEIWNAGSDTLTYTLSETCNWLTVNPTSGSSTGEHDTINVNVDTSNLQAGSHSCDIDITTNDGDGTFTVTLNVIEPGQPLLDFYPSSYNFGYKLEGQTDSTILSIWNAGSETLHYTLSESCDWVEVDPTSGESTGEVDEITVSIDTTGLNIGEYSCPITINSDGGTDTFLVSFEIVPDQPILSFQPKSHDFGNVVRGQTKTTTFKIWNSGTETLTYNIVPSLDWVTVSPTSGSSTGEQDTINVEVDTSNLDLGSHTCPVVISSNGGDGVYNVNVNVIETQETTLAYSPTSHNFGDVPQGQIRTTSFQIWNSGDGTLTYQLSENCNWVTVNPTSGSSSGERDNINIIVDTTSLNLGTHTCAISINSNGGTGTFTININVIEPPVPPGLPFEPYPKDGAQNMPINIGFRWSCNEITSLKYDVYMEANDQTPGKLVSYDQSEKSFKPMGLNPGTRYYWRVVSRDPQREEIEGPVWSFTTSGQGFNMTVLKPQPGMVYLKNRIVKSLIFSLFETSIVVSPTLDIEVAASNNIEQIEFIVKNKIKSEEQIDDDPSDGFSSSFDVRSGSYQIVVNAYSDKNRVIREIIPRVLFIKK